MRLVAYETVPSQGFGPVTALHQREWMDLTHERSAYRCLPMLVANQAGWLITCPATVRLKWNGGPNVGDIEIQRWAESSGDVLEDYYFPASHFGSGVITWTLPWLFRTPPGYGLLVRGPANSPKDGISPLEGMVETDWTPATFTMNWKITRPDEWIIFMIGEAICMIVPQRWSELEEFRPEVLPISSDPELEASNARWCESRDKFNAERKEKGSEAAKKGWEKDYFRGMAPDGISAPQHRTKLRLREFKKYDQ